MVREQHVSIAGTDCHSIIDMAERIKNSSYRLSRPPNHIGRYKMIRHEKRERAVNR